ncbi:MAG: hypothetical protein JJ863_20825 [Deltaproteobacteria bacterium]|nr:hypothetical protein [Deltaproteobacteria bacterium]
MAFRDRLLATLRAAQSLLDVPGVVVGGSEVPNLLQSDAASTLVVSEDVDLVIPVAQIEAIKERIGSLAGLTRSADEPSVWVPDDAETMIELNLIGRDDDVSSADETYFLEDATLPLVVFGPLSLLSVGETRVVDGVRVPLPDPAGLFLEKLVTDRTSRKGDRDLLVALGLLMVGGDVMQERAERLYRKLPDELRHAVRSNLSILSLMPPHDHMPDPTPHRAAIAELLRRMEALE